VSTKSPCLTRTLHSGIYTKSTHAYLIFSRVKSRSSNTRPSLAHSNATATFLPQFVCHIAPPPPALHALPLNYARILLHIFDAIFFISRVKLRPYDTQTPLSAFVSTLQRPPPPPPLGLSIPLCPPSSPCFTLKLHTICVLCFCSRVKLRSYDTRTSLSAFLSTPR